MNQIILKGIIRDIQYSHTIENVRYEKAHIIVKGQNNRDHILTVCYKELKRKYKDGDEVSLSGNIRTHSFIKDEKRNVELYVFTYLDVPYDSTQTNEFAIDGTICKLGELITYSNCDKILFTLINIIDKNNAHLYNYLPCVAFNSVAKQISKLSLGDKILIKGEVRSREYKNIDQGTQEISLRIIHELAVTDFEILSEVCNAQ